MNKLKSQLAVAALLACQQAAVEHPKTLRRKGERLRGLMACDPVRPGSMKIGRNDPCPCGKRNEKSLEWRLVDGAMKQVPRPMKFKNCCHRKNPVVKNRPTAPVFEASLKSYPLRDAWVKKRAKREGARRGAMLKKTTGKQLAR